MVKKEQETIDYLKPLIDRGRDGDWEHCKRVAGLVKKIGVGREYLFILLTSAYIHDIGWKDVLPPGKITFEKLLEYEQTANDNSEPFIKDALGVMGYSESQIEIVIRIVGAVDNHLGVEDDEKVVVDADNISKLCMEHLQEKFQKPEWPKLVKMWEKEFPKRIQTEMGKKIYPELMSELKKKVLGS